MIAKDIFVIFVLFFSSRHNISDSSQFTSIVLAAFLQCGGNECALERNLVVLC